MEPINIHLREVSEIHNNISRDRLQLKLIMRHASAFRKQHLLNRASTMNLENCNQDEK